MASKYNFNMPVCSCFTWVGKCTPLHEMFMLKYYCRSCFKCCKCSSIQALPWVQMSMVTLALSLSHVHWGHLTVLLHQRALLMLMTWLFLLCFDGVLPRLYSATEDLWRKFLPIGCPSCSCIAQPLVAAQCCWWAGLLPKDCAYFACHGEYHMHMLLWYLQGWAIRINLPS